MQASRPNARWTWEPAKGRQGSEKGARALRFPGDQKVKGAWGAKAQQGIHGQRLEQQPSLSFPADLHRRRPPDCPGAKAPGVLPGDPTRCLAAGADHFGLPSSLPRSDPVRFCQSRRLPLAATCVPARPPSGRGAADSSSRRWRLQATSRGLPVPGGCPHGHMP